MDIYCSNCGHAVDLRASSCGDCGAGASDEHLRLAASLPPIRPGQNSFALTSLVLAILGFTVLPFVSGIAALTGCIAAVIFGHLGRRQLREQPQNGANVVVAGLIIGYLGIVGYVGLAVLTFWLENLAFWF